MKITCSTSKHDDILFISLCEILGGESILAASKSSREISKNLVRVKSSNVWAYCVDVKNANDKTGTVYVQFKGANGGPGDVYCYYDVPIVVYRRWHTATSKGHFFWKYIRNNYKYAKLTGDKRTHLKNGVNYGYH